jgi:transposase
MRIKNILQKDYTINQKFYQLKLPLNIDYMIPANDSVRLLSQFVEEMDLTDLYSTYSRIKENQVSPRKMLKIMIYAYMNKLYSSRDIENACHRDINFMFLLEGSTATDHATFARFRSLHFAPCAEGILAEMTNFLYDIKVVYKNTVQMRHVKKLRKKLYELKNLEGIKFVHRYGKRKTPLQSSIETLEEYLSKFKDYTQKVYKQKALLPK